MKRFSGQLLQRQNSGKISLLFVAGPGPDDSYADNRSNYTTNEVAVDYNAGFTGVSAALTQSGNSWAACVNGGYSTGSVTLPQ